MTDYKSGLYLPIITGAIHIHIYISH